MGIKILQVQADLKKMAIDRCTSRLKAAKSKEVREKYRERIQQLEQELADIRAEILERKDEMKQLAKDEMLNKALKDDNREN